MLSIADDGVGLNVKTDPRSTGMGQRIVSAMAAKLEASVERDPAHAGTRIVLRFPAHQDLGREIRKRRDGLTVERAPHRLADRARARPIAQAFPPCYARRS